MNQYETMLRHVRDNGVKKGDRTGTGTTSVFGYQMRFNLAEGFPLITTKHVPLRLIIAELLWFLSGSTNIGPLLAQNCHIWDEWADENGNLGPVYGEQWRSWPGELKWTRDQAEAATKGKIRSTAENPHTETQYLYQESIDQISWIVDRIKTNPDCRRLIVSSWNVADLPKMALMPCHALFQFYTQELTADERFNLYDGPKIGIFPPPGPEDTEAEIAARVHSFLDEQRVPSRKLSCQLYQRSCDTFLGVPFNIASYALLTHMIAQQCDMAVGDFIWTGGDVHIYNNHRDQVEEQLSRAPLPYPTLQIGRKPASVFEYEPSDFGLVNYYPHPAIKAPVAV